jgi:chromosome segregation ATPase
MTIEEIDRVLQTSAQNQAQADERLNRVAERLDQVVALQTQHSADIAEIDKMLATLVRSQNRYDVILSRHDDILHDLADKQLKNEERFADLADAQPRYEERHGRLEAMFEMLATFVREARAETNGRFDQMATFVRETQAETNGRFDRMATHLDQLTLRVESLAVAQDRTDQQMRRTDDRINALIEAQARTDERINELFNRNGTNS